MPRILLAEGHPPTREFVARALADAGLRVVQAEDAATAWARYAELRPEAVVLAADLGGDAGPAALVARIRGADPGAVLILADREHLGRARGRQAAIAAKANAYVADPTSRELVEKVRELASRPARGRGALRGAALVLSRAPSARGDVKPGVVARLLHQIWRSVSDGVLAVEDAGVERRLLFLRGVPAGCQSDDPADGLARWLLDGGRMDAAAHEAALEAMAGGLSHGAALIAAGVLEHGEPLQAALRSHLGWFAQRLVGAREGRWRFHAGAEHASEVQPVDLLPLGVILEGARAHVPLRHFADALRAVTEAYPVRTGDFQQILPAAGLGTQDLRLALSLDGRTATRPWLEARQADLKDALSLLWFLSMVGAVAFHETPETAGAEYGAAPPRRRKPLPADRAEAVRQAALQILPGTYLHALGLDISAGDEEVERAYREVASRFHPDGFAEYDVGELEDLLAAVQDKVTAAYRVLSSAERRRAYLSFLLLRLELSGQRRAGIDLDAEIALKRGERALRARRAGDAAAALCEAVERNPKEPEYAALLAFAELFDPALPPAERAEAARRTARKALALVAQHPRATAALALAEEALGDVAEARRVVLAALEVHPGSEVLRGVLRRLSRARAG